MSLGKRLTADLLFVVQIILGVIFCGSQFFRLLETTQGQLLGMMLLIEAYLCMHGMLATGAHRAQPSRVTRQMLWTYGIWLMLVASNILAVFLNGSYEWSQNDTRTILFALVGTSLLIIAMRIRGIRLENPMFKSLLAMLFKVVPQFVMAFEVAQKGGAGVPGVAILLGNLMILIRLGQLWFAVREAGWDRNRVWLCVSETMNEISWAAVSIVWLFVS